eukprot:196971_1
MGNTASKQEQYVVSIGENHYGQFGMGHRRDKSKLARLKTPTTVQQFYCGGNFNIYLDNESNYWCAGLNSYGQCAKDMKYTIIPKWTRINFFKNKNIKIRQLFVSYSANSVFWLTENNKVYGNGQNNHYQLGIIGDNKNHYIPQLIPIHFVKQIRSAEDYSICLCDYSSIIEWFCQPIIILKEVLQIIKEFSGRISNQIFSTNSYSEYGGNGLGKQQKKDGKWYEIEIFKDKNIIQIETGVRHSLFLQDNGTLWSCGGNDKGQCGIGSYRKNAKDNMYKPHKIWFFHHYKIKIVDMKCCFLYNLAVDNNNKVYFWGLQPGSVMDIKSPNRIEFFKEHKVVEIKCGFSHSAIYCDNGEWYLFGSNTAHECMKSNTHAFSQPYAINSLVQHSYHRKSIKEVYLGSRSTSFLVG